MSSLVTLIREKIENCINDLGYKIYHIKYVREFGHNYLRIMIQNKDSSKSINVSGCEKVSKSINLLVDNIEIENEFFLEVSSTGINRKLYTLEHIKDSINSKVCVELKNQDAKSKRYNGFLKNVENNEISLDIDGCELKINLEQVKNINLEEIS